MNNGSFYFLLFWKLFLILIPDKNDEYKKDLGNEQTY